MKTLEWLGLGLMAVGLGTYGLMVLFERFWNGPGAMKLTKEPDYAEATEEDTPRARSPAMMWIKSIRDAEVTARDKMWVQEWLQKWRQDDESKQRLDELTPEIVRTNPPADRVLILTPGEDAKPWYMLDDDDLDISSKIVGVNLSKQARHDAEDEQQAVANCTLCGQPLNDGNSHGYCGTLTRTLNF